MRENIVCALQKAAHPMIPDSQAWARVVNLGVRFVNWLCTLSPCLELS